MTSNKSPSEHITHIIDVRGDFACYSRPELSAERYSYPCPTPSGARGIFDAIYFKPQFYWQVDRIDLLTMPAYIALRRNEVGGKAPSDRTIASWSKGTRQPQALMADSPDRRQQRQTMALRNPQFRLHAHIVPRPGHEGQQKAFDEQFRRRAAAGKCAWQPYLGCREFVAFFELVNDPTGPPRPVELNQAVGWMLYDVFDLSQPNRPGAAKPSISVFHAEIRHGVLDVPPYDSDLVRKPGGRRAG
ncbi:MAG: type I-C CRISPR-associated protein Cas5c [Planctomycetota bacterium]